MKSILRKIYARYLRSRGIGVGPSSKISPKASFCLKWGGRVTAGRSFAVRPYARIETYGGDIVIGDYVSINPYCVIYGHGGLRIGNGVMIGAHTVIIPGNHGFDDPDSPIRAQEITRKGIVIGNDVWLGAGVRVLDGVSIADGCVIGAGSVVTRSTQPYGVYAGAPARLIRDRRAREAA